MGSVKERNGKDLTEAEETKKRWQQYTELYKEKVLNPDNHNSVFTYLEPDILECSQLGIKKHYYEQLVEVIEFQLSYFKS